MKIGALALAMLLLLGSASGQSNRNPYSREAAEKSFRALAVARDSDILDILKHDGLVCFAESLPVKIEDRFITIDLPKPTSWCWLPDTESNAKSNEEGASFYDGKSESPAICPSSLHLDEWENQAWHPLIIPSGVEGGWHSYGHYEILKNGRAGRLWKAYDDMPPVFRFAKGYKDKITGATYVSAVEDDTTFYASKKYENQNVGPTTYATYEMNVRLSTGRYKETWTAEEGDAFESVGNCYKAKEFVTTIPAKKTK